MQKQLRLVCLIVLVLLTAQLSRAELKKKTNDAFNTYDRLTQERFDKETSEQAFLYFNQLPDAQKKALQARMDAGEVVIEKLTTLNQGNPIDVPSGMIHHWRGVVFVPGATLAQTIALVQDYDHHSLVYQPDVARSKLMHREGNNFHIYYRLRRKKVITVVLDTEYDVHYEPLSPTRMVSKSISSSIREVENPGKPDENVKPAGYDTGFMWRLNTYWHMEEKNGGVYIQCEAVSLSRDIPAGLGWMIRPFVEDVPKESLMFTLGRTRETLLKTVSEEKSKQAHVNSHSGTRTH